MDIKTFTEKGQVTVTVMHVDGNIDSSTYEAFQAKADELIKNGAQYILVDLTHTDFVSSAGRQIQSNDWKDVTAVARSVYVSMNMSKPLRVKAIWVSSERLSSFI